MTPDLFQYADRYPVAPGFKARATSAAAASSVAPSAANIRARCLDVLKRVPLGLTADEVAEKLNMSILTIRPRISELSARAMIKDTGDRRSNDSGRRAIVWAATEEQPAAQGQGS